MLFKKFQLVAQVVGFTTMTLLAVYGLLSFLGNDTALAAVLGRSQTAAPVIPATFNYQGFLRDSGGQVMTGNYTMTARIYDTLDVAGATLYTETFRAVTVRDGWFNIVLGDDPQGQDLQAVFSSTPRYLGLTLEGQDSELTRQRFHGVPWALYATNASQADDFTVAGQLTATTITASGPASVAGLTVNGNATVGGNANINGTIAAGGSITASGDISWTGHLQGMQIVTSTITDTFYLFVDHTSGYKQLLPVGNNMCFLSDVTFKALLDYGRDARCFVAQESGYWTLHAYAHGYPTNPSQAGCGAICLQW